MLAFVAVAGTSASQQLGQSRTERRLNDSVRIRAMLSVVSSSTTPRGGRVDYFAAIRNDGPRQVRLMAVSINQDGLRIRARRLGTGAFVQPGAVRSLLLSVRLDCAFRVAGASSAALRGVVNVRPDSGRLHHVRFVLSQPGPLTGAADTLCTIGPHRFGELSGPILAGNDG